LNKEFAKDILNKIKNKNVDLAEVYHVSSSGTKIDIHSQNVESIDNISSAGVGIRVINKNRLGFAFTSNMIPEKINEAISEAINNSNDACDDKNNVMSFPSKSSFKDCIFDEEIAKTSIEKKIEIAKKVESTAYAYDKRVKNTEKVSYSDGEYNIIIMNSNGVDIEYKGTSCGVFAEVIASSNGENEAGFGVDFKMFLNKVDVEKAGIEAATRAVELLGAKTVNSGKMSLIMEPFIAVQFLDVISDLISADMVQKGKSLLAGKIGEIIATKLLSIVDNGILPGGIGSSPYDCEGIPSQKTVIVENGVLKSFIYNTYTASKGSTKSTGNAVRGSFKTTPGIGTTNFYIEQGKSNPADIIKTVKNGLIVKRVMGMHTVNPITGEFSVGASGILIENGEITFPVRGITIAGNLIDFLRSIQAVGNDLKFIGSSGSPTLLISDIAVSGS